MIKNIIMKITLFVVLLAITACGPTYITNDKMKRDLKTVEVTGDTQYAISQVFRLKGANDIRINGDGWVTFKWKDRYYLLGVHRTAYDAGYMVEISEEQYNRE